MSECPAKKSAKALICYPALRKRKLRLADGTVIENGHFKSINACILFSQLLYWFERMETDDIFKFAEPCGHPLYKDGDSWCEELSFSRAEFNNARCETVTHYASKTSWQRAQDKFKGLPFCSYVDKQIRLTIYVANWPVIDGIMKYIDPERNTQFNKVKSLGLNKVQLPVLTKSNHVTEESSIRYYTEITQEITSNNDHASEPLEFKSFDELRKSQLNYPPVTQKVNSEKSRATGNASGEEAFEEFWKLYPRKQKKNKARQSFGKALLKAGGGSAGKELILSAVKKYADFTKGDDLKYIALPTSWLNGEQWNDELPANKTEKQPVSSRYKAEEAAKAVTEREIERVMASNGQKSK